MGSNQGVELSAENRQEDLQKLLQLNGALTLYTAITAAIELNLFEIIANSGPNAHLSSAQIVSRLPAKSPETPAMLDRILHLLSSHSILTCTLVSSEHGHTTKLFGLTPMSEYLVPDSNGISFAPSILIAKEKAIVDCGNFLKEAILEGGTPFHKANGMHLFEYIGNSSRLNEVFNRIMASHTSVFMRAVLETYNGFEDLKEVVDVGGGLGTTLHMVVSKYPRIRGINFDLPFVIKNARAYAGVEHVEGDMFQCVPRGEAILLKNVLHDWTDDQCLKLLKNCWDALPKSGKVIAIDAILPEFPNTDPSSQFAYISDVGILLASPGGRERTFKEFDALAKAAGFPTCKLVARTNQYGVLEFFKN